MGFKENLIAALEMVKLARTVDQSFGGSDSERRIDKDSARSLLEAAGYAPRQERDLELYLPVSTEAGEGIVVLDNDLSLYRTAPEDIAMRKSPTVKEMLSLRNVKKILNDADVVESKQRETVRTLYHRYVDRLDLSFSKKDIDALAADGGAALDRELTEEVVEVLDLFAALLDFEAPPRVLALSQHYIRGRAERRPDGEIRFGPLVLYSRVHNRLVLVDEPVGSRDPEVLERLAAAAGGEAPVAAKGSDVFSRLGLRVLERLPEGVFPPPEP
ncbi:MAG: hypothetical protein ACOWWM_18875 [Desulfobacterales bacterium]